MKTFDYKRRMYLIIFFGLIYNLYLYQKEEATCHKPKVSMANTVTLPDQLNLKDSSSLEFIKSHK